MGHYNAAPVFLAGFFNPEDNMMHFRLMCDMNGDLIYDGCSDNYLKGGVVYSYHAAEYNSQVKKLFNDFFRNGRSVSGSVSKVLNANKREASFTGSGSNPWEGYQGPVPEPDKEYDKVELAKQYGYINFCFTEDEEHTKENLCQRLLQCRELIEDSGTPFTSLSAGYHLGGGVYNLTEEELFEGELRRIVEERYINYYSDENT